MCIRGSPYPPTGPRAMARLVVRALLADGQRDERELAALERRGAFAALGISREDFVQVLFPSSPMPASGFLFMAPVADVYLVDLNIEEFTKVVVRFGSLTSQVFERDVRFRGVPEGFDDDQNSMIVGRGGND